MIGVDGALYKSHGIHGRRTQEPFPWKISLCISNMAIEAGAKNGIFMVDEITEDYMDRQSDRENGKSLQPDEDAEYVADV